MSKTASFDAQFMHNLGIIAQDESLTKRLVRYVSRLAKPKEDDSLMTKEEFFRNIEEAERQYERGEYITLLPGESVPDMLKRCGYGV